MAADVRRLIATGSSQSEAAIQVKAHGYPNARICTVLGVKTTLYLNDQPPVDAKALAAQHGASST